MSIFTRKKFDLLIEGDKKPIREIRKMIREKFLNGDSRIRRTPERYLLFKANIHGDSSPGIGCEHYKVMDEIDKIYPDKSSVVLLIRCLTCENYLS